MAYVPPHRRKLQQQDTAPSSVPSSVPRSAESAHPMQRVPTQRVCRSGEEAKTRAPAINRNLSSKCIEHSIGLIFCINLERRRDKWLHTQKQVQETRCKAFQSKLQRFNAIEGCSVRHSDNETVRRDWDATKNAQYSRSARPGRMHMTDGEVGCALSHIALWRKLLDSDEENMMVLEDDILFSQKKGKTRFIEGLDKAWALLPENSWDMLMLGLSHRGERIYLNQLDPKQKQGLDVQLYQPEYGYHTHAYIISRQAAQILIESLPVRGPLDVWLADNHWFDMKVYCAVIANEGWRLEDGTYEGSDLVRQHRPKGFSSDIPSSAGN